MSVCRSMLALGLVLSALAGCDFGGGDEPTAERTGQNADQGNGTTETNGETNGSAAAKRPVRLLRLGNFDAPTYLAAPRGDSRRFVVQRDGTIVIVKGGRQLDTPFLDIHDRVTTGGESGLLSMAFARDYKSSGLFYVYYTDQQGYIQIDQFRRSGNPDRADSASRRSVLRVPHHRFNHKGGQLQVGADGMLYAGFGDGGAGGDPDENAQNLSRLLGKLIRIDPRPGGGYSISSSNPFTSRGGARGEIYAYGLRNPYRFSFDRSRGSLIIGDVGQDEVEEIDFIPSRNDRLPRGGYNFGWDTFEGNNRYESGGAPGHVRPVIAETHDDGWCSIIGGYVIRDRSLRGSRYAGRYIYGDYCKQELRLAFLKRPRAPTRDSGLRVSGLVSFGEDGHGRVYAVSMNGPIYRIGRG